MDISTVLKSILHLDSQIQGPLISLEACTHTARHICSELHGISIETPILFVQPWIVPLIVSQSLHEFGMKVK